MEIVAEGGVTTPSGFLAGAARCGLKSGSDLDLALLYSPRDCSAAGVFTRNRVVAAPVLLDRETLEANNNAIRGVVANAGNANACTGAPGVWAARQMQQNAAFALGCRPEQLLVLSTGVIGVQLPMPKVNAGIDSAANRLGGEQGEALARAIMTTDTHPKEVAVRLTAGGKTVYVGGVAKGSGMIHPDMATMLAVITTDASVPAELVQPLLDDAVNQSFNRISVDGDTSTNDTVLLLCNGASGVLIDHDHGWEALGEAVNYVCRELAQMIVRDGEGATKFVAIEVYGARSEEDAHAVANTIATSPLVKTALAGSDANWGRILAAAGRAGVPFEQSETALWVANPSGRELQLVSEGTPTAYEEAEAATIFAEQDINIRLQLGNGDGEATVWTCDLSHDYVTINADYRS
ncbi:MAG TPA: bifunctional glutamate N-acetyltransferase/amino-acid acetyltransferase ArgJ [Candidatus Sulfomarinibacteraceae bacterium]|nr:bifunctional glutamate N-acetyltransferase/amino-acid acetyltransferase ArgJ [Candidatus Sulfomarinibacteraceae bacterium]